MSGLKDYSFGNCETFSILDIRSYNLLTTFLRCVCVRESLNTKRVRLSALYVERCLIVTLNLNSIRVDF